MRKLRGKSDVTVTPYNTNTNTISSLRSDIPRAKRAPTSGFDRFLSVYPKRINKKAALARWQTAVKAGTDPERIIAGAAAYAEWVRASGTEPKFVKAPDAWLNAGKWDDELPEIGKVNGGPTKYELWAARVEREAEEHDNEQESNGNAGEAGVSGPDDTGEVPDPRGGGHPGPFDRGAGQLWRERTEGRGVFHYSDPQISDMADDRRDH
jgi:hypothetical protein